MIPISRDCKSTFLESLISSIEKKAFSIERLSTGIINREDPFENFATDDVWKINGNKLLKNTAKGISKWLQHVVMVNLIF